MCVRVRMCQGLGKLGSSKRIQIRMGTGSRERLSQKTRRETIFSTILLHKLQIATTSLSSPVYVLTHALQHERSEMIEADDIHTPRQGMPHDPNYAAGPGSDPCPCDWSSSFFLLFVVRCALDREHTRPRQHEVAYVRNATRLGTPTAIPRGGVYMSSLEATDNQCSTS